MVKRYGNLFDKICTIENLETAFYKAARHKRDYDEVIKYERNLVENLFELQWELINGKYKTGKYRTKVIFEPKKRIIYILDFKHRVAQWAIINVIEDILVKMLTKDTYSCIKDRGMHKASLRTTEFINKYDYVLKMDIHHFYPSVRQDILYKLIIRKFKDKKLLALLTDIIFSFPGIRNIPIGNLSSQHFGNFYMKELDKYILETLKCKAYIGFEFYYEGTPHVIFTSSGTLIYLIQKYYQKDGLECKIVRRNGQLVLE